MGQTDGFVASDENKITRLRYLILRICRAHAPRLGDHLMKT